LLYNLQWLQSLCQLPFSAWQRPHYLRQLLLSRRRGGLPAIASAWALEQPTPPSPLPFLPFGSSTDAACIYIASGTYEEQLTIDYDGALTIYGETSDSSTSASNDVTITHTIDSTDAGTLDESSTVNIVSSNVSLYNLNIVNGYGYGSQAVAVTANADQLAFYQCSFSGYQDTLYSKAGTQYYSGCLIEGAVDYIFGDALAWFTGCTIMSNGGGSITANSREETSDSAWYVFDNVNVTSNGTDLEREVYLGRPWRVDARVMYQNSYLSNIINAEGWKTMADNATP
jgi:pectinesterase